MEELVDEGLVKNIGLSNVQGSLLLDVLRYARIPPQVLQIEIHPYLTQEQLVKLAQLHGIAVTAYSSFGPAVSQRISPGPQHTIDVWLDRATSNCQWIRARPVSWSMPWLLALLRKNRRVGCATIGLKHFDERNLGEGQILLAWALARNLAVIPKSTDHNRLVKNLEAGNIKLTAGEIKRISDLNLDLRVGMALLVFRKSTNGFLDSS